MELNLLPLIILLIPMMVLIGVAVGAALAAWPVTNRLSRRLKEGITVVATFIILLSLALLVSWIGFEFPDVSGGVTVSS